MGHVGTIFALIRHQSARQKSTEREWSERVERAAFTMLATLPKRRQVEVQLITKKKKKGGGEGVTN